MASANSSQPLPNPAIYDFEGQFEDAIKKAFATVTSAQVAAQQDADILMTPRFEAMFESGQQEQRSYLVPGTNDPATNLPWAYQNVWNGILRVKVATNRLKDKGILFHRQCRATLRMMMLNYIKTVNPELKYISIVQSLESSTQVNVVDEHDQDVSAIAFKMYFNIQPSSFPVPA